MAGKSRQALILFCLCSLGLNFNPCTHGLAGVPSAAAQSQRSFKLRVDVDLVTIEVIALDSKGKPVRNLKKEDFRLYEDGKKQEILSIDEVNGESAISSLGTSPLNEGELHRGKTVLILFDDSTIEPQFVKTSRDSAEKFVKDHMRPQDLFAVASFSTSMKILQNFTSEREEVLAAIEQPANSTPAGQFYFEDMLRAVEKINYSVARLKGQKTVLIYTCAGYFHGAVLQTTYGKTLDSAKRSNVVFYTIDPGTTIRSSPAGYSPNYNSPVNRNRLNVGGSDAGIIPVTLKSLASESGGFPIYSTNAIDSELDKLDQQISNYYILGFQSNNPKHDGAFRKLEAKTELKGVTLRHRSGYLDRRPIDVLASSKQEQTLLTALSSPGTATQLPILFRPVYFYDSPRVARVLVAARIRTGKMVFKKKGGQLGANLNIMGVAYAEDGSIVARFSETLPISFDVEKESEFRNGNLAYRNYFKLRPGKYRLKLAASDESNNLGSMEQSLVVPALSEQGFAGSSIVLVEQTSQLPGLIQNLQTQLLDESDPLLYSGMQIEPRVENRLPVNSAVCILFRIYNLPGRSDQWDLVANPKLIAEKGKELTLDPISLKKALSPAGSGEAVVGLSLPLQGVAPGKYRLIIEITEAASTQTATLQTDIEFIN